MGTGRGVIIPASGSGVQPFVKMRTASGWPAHIWQPMDGAGNTDGTYVGRFTSTGFVVRGTAAPNASTVTYSWIALMDPAQRSTKYGSWRTWSGLDNEVVPIGVTGQSSFTPELAIIQSGSLNNSLLNCWVRGPGNTGDQATLWTGTGSGDYAQADKIQALGSDSLEVGTGANVTNTSWFNSLAVRDTAFVTDTLWQVFTYTGNGSSPRVISLPAAMSSKTPRMILLQAAGYPGSVQGGYVWTTETGSSSKKMVDGTFAAEGVTAVAAGQFTVSSTANANTVVYNVWVLSDGTDVTAVPSGFPGILTFTLEALAYYFLHWPRRRKFRVQCEQKRIPVYLETRTFPVPCEQRRFSPDPYSDRKL